MRSRLRLVVAVMVLCAALSLALACSVVMAANQPGKKDLEVLEKGTPRAVVISQLGTPQASMVDEDAKHCHESYAFKQGYSVPTKVGRAVFHAAADVFTYFLWEVVAIPIESHFDGTEVKVEVLYDEYDRVDSVCVFAGADELEDVDSVVSPEEIKRRLHPETEAPE